MLNFTALVVPSKINSVHICKASKTLNNHENLTPLIETITVDSSHLGISVDVHGPEVDVAVDEPPAGHQLAFQSGTIFGHLNESS